jgi:ribose 5-phosphate isomerase A
MADPGADVERAKRAAAERAVTLVEPGMTVGLGTGSTAAHFVELLAARAAAEALDLACVATSEATAALATARGLRVVPLDGSVRIDLTVDGADEVDGTLRLIKGGGAALLREKIVANASERMVVIADAGKRVATLGAFPLPVEVVRFGLGATRAAVQRLLLEADVDERKIVVRMADDAPLVTDEGHHILDLHLTRIGNPPALGAALVAVPGVVEHGLFIGMAERAILGRADGTVTELAADGEPGLTPSEARSWAEELTRSVEQ